MSLVPYPRGSRAHRLVTIRLLDAERDGIGARAAFPKLDVTFGDDVELPVMWSGLRNVPWAFLNGEEGVSDSRSGVLNGDGAHLACRFGCPQR